MDFADKLNELSALIEESEVDALLAHLRATLPETAASRDVDNTLRIVLAMLLVDSLKSASLEEKAIFMSNITSETLGDEARVCTELAVPDNFEGVEVLRVLEETANNTKTGDFLIMVKPQAVTPDAWGVVLHNVARNIADGLVENRAIRLVQRTSALNAIAYGFQAEHNHASTPSAPSTPSTKSN